MNTSKNKESKSVSQIKVTIMMMVLFIIIYVAMVQIWEATSTEYLPTNFLDHEVKTPADSEDWLVRRKNGV